VIGWSSVVGMQYLREAFFLCQKFICSVNASLNTPDRVELLVHISCLGILLDELLHYLQLPITASFKTTRIVKDKTRVALKYHLIFDVMLSTLWCEDIIAKINTWTLNYLPSKVDQGWTTRSEITGMSVGIGRELLKYTSPFYRPDRRL
jgi:hypothetical protein